MKKNHTMQIAAAAGLILASLAAAGYAAEFSDLAGGRLAVAAAEKLTQAAIPEVSRNYISEPPKLYPEKQCYDIRQIDQDGPERFLWADFHSSYSQRVCEENQYGVEQCHWQTLASYNARAEVTVHHRELKDGEAEVFTLCYDFARKKGSYSIKSPFVYDEKVRFLSGNRDGFALELTPLRRKPVAPAAGILELQSFSYDQVRGEFTLKLQNRAAAEYLGSRVQVGVELVQDKMFDSSLGVKFFEFPLNYGTGDLTVAFKDSDFSSDKEAAEFRAKTKNYFVKWGFKVLSEKFKGDYMEKGRTDAIAVLK